MTRRMMQPTAGWRTGTITENLHMNRLFTLLAIAMGLCATNWVVAQSQKDEQPSKDTQVKVGLTINDAKAYQGYTLFSPMGSTMTYLIDMKGRIVRNWEGAGSPAMYASLLPNGNLLRPCVGGPKEKKDKGGMPGMGGRIQEFNWDGELVWDYKFPSDKFSPHHDMIKLPNGNVLAIVASAKTAQEASAAGRKNAGGMIQNDCIVE